MIIAEHVEPRGSGDLIMEALAARWRLGERSWTFKNEHRRIANGLVERGLINVQSDVVQGSFRASLTDAGCKMYLMDDYQLPWWIDHQNLAMTAQFMLNKGQSVEDIIYMVEKPWKHNDDFNLASAEVDLPNG
jgi:hypothetical protein